MNVIQLSRDSDGLAYPAAAKASAPSPGLPRPITRRYCEALSHCLYAYDQIARSYFALAQLFPQSAAREILLGDIAFARTAIHNASANMSVEAVSTCDKSAPARSYLSLAASDAPQERNDHPGYESTSATTSSPPSRIRIPGLRK